MTNFKIHISLFNNEPDKVSGESGNYKRNEADRQISEYKAHHIVFFKTHQKVEENRAGMNKVQVR